MSFYPCNYLLTCIKTPLKHAKKVKHGKKSNMHMHALFTTLSHLHAIDSKSRAVLSLPQHLQTVHINPSHRKIMIERLSLLCKPSTSEIRGFNWILHVNYDTQQKTLYLKESDIFIHMIAHKHMHLLFPVIPLPFQRIFVVCMLYLGVDKM